MPRLLAYRASGMGGPRQRTLDVSRWAKRRLAQRLAGAGDEHLSYVIPDGLRAQVAHQEKALDLLAAAMDAVLVYEPREAQVLLELGQAPSHGGHDAVFVFRRDGGVGAPSPEDLQELQRRAHQIGGKVRIIEHCSTSLSAVVAVPLATRAGRRG